MESIDPRIQKKSVEVEFYDDGFFLGPASLSGAAEPSNQSDDLGGIAVEASASSDTAGAMPETETASVPEAIKIPDRTYFRIGDVAELVGVKPYVLRYWETEFPMICPQKSNTGQRVYRRVDVETVLLIKHLLYRERYSIEGARKRIQELRREGRLKSFKREKVLGGEEAVARIEQAKKARALIHELHDLVQVPLREFFKY